MADQIDEDLLLQGASMLQSFFDIPRSDIDDVVDEVFKIHLDEKIYELSNDFCKYYYASNNNNRGEDSYFAIIYEKSFVVDVKAIKSLLEKPINGINKIISWSITRISSDNIERLVVIVDSYDYDNNLFSYIKKNGPISLSSNQKIITKLTNIIHEASSRKIYNYNISASNILLDENGNFLAIREFINSYPYFYQQDEYIAPEISECLQASRRTKNSYQDIYALGVTVFYSFSALTPWDQFLQSYEYNEARFEHGNYEYLIKFLASNQKVPENFKIFLRFTLHDEMSKRWNTKEIYDWLAGKNDINTYDLANSGNSKYIIGFNGKKYSNLKSLSYGIFCFWDKASKFVKETKLWQWSAKQQLNNDILNSLKSLLNVSSDDLSSTAINNRFSAKKLPKLLSLLDYNGPLRYENIAVSAESIPETMQYLQTEKRRILVDQLIKMIQEKAWEDYLNSDAVGFLSKEKGDKFYYIATNDNNTSLYKNNERMIYALNPYLPCLSPILTKKYIIDTKSLLVTLEQFAVKAPHKFKIDQHILAFITAKLDLKKDVKPVILQNFPKIAEHFAIKTLSIINLLHKNHLDIKLVGICKFFGNELVKLFQHRLYNIELKKNISDQIIDASGTGDLSKIIAVFSNQQQFIDDYNGYYESCEKIKLLETKIMKLSSQTDSFNDTAIIFGQKTTVFTSYILFFIAIIIMII